MYVPPIKHIDVLISILAIDHCPNFHATPSSSLAHCPRIFSQVYTYDSNFRVMRKNMDTVSQKGAQNFAR